MASNGSVLFECDSLNGPQFVNGKFVLQVNPSDSSDFGSGFGHQLSYCLSPSQVQQTALATLSMGPVGLADQLSAPPDNTTATITSNKTLVAATPHCRRHVLNCALVQRIG